MPTISRFLGIVIRMYWDDHAPPHFHAVYGECVAEYSIKTANARRGGLPPRAHALVVEWIGLHRDELYRDWELAKLRLPLKKIEPLE